MLLSRSGENCAPHCSWRLDRLLGYSCTICVFTWRVRKNQSYHKMVTTIKITCDGVFIQSNPFFTQNANLRGRPSAPAADDGNSHRALHTTIPPEVSPTGTSSSASSSSSLDVTTAEDDVQSMESGGNMTVVIRNNRRKIGRLSTGESFLIDDRDDVDNWREPQEAMRPSYHYMYLVRKVPASRVLAAKSVAIRGGDETVSRRPQDDNDAAAAAGDNGVRSVIEKTSSGSDEDGDVGQQWTKDKKQMMMMMVMKKKKLANLSHDDFDTGTDATTVGDGKQEEEMQHQKQQQQQQSPAVDDVGQ